MTKIAMISSAVAVIAMIAHEANRAYCEYCGDNSQVDWDAAPEWQRDSAIKGVEFHIANPDATDASSHENWMAQKIAEGWTYGPLKDADAKVHPCLVPFADLPREQQFKDRLFRQLVHAAAAAIAPLVRENVDAMERADGNAASADAAQREIDDLKAKLEKALKTAKGKVAAGDRPARPRKVRAMPDSLTGEALAAALTAAEEAGDRIEIAFSDGRQEAALPPVIVSGPAWRAHPRGRMLAEPVQLRGADAAAQVRGYALMIGGKQVAFCERSEPISIAPGQSVQISDDIFF